MVASKAANDGATMNIGTACKLIAKSKRITAAEISRNTGISQSYLSMLFAGKIDDPQVKRIYLIAHELGMTVDELLDWASREGE